MRNRALILFLLAGLMLLMMACGFSANPTPDTGDQTDMLNQTLSALQTLSVGQTAVAQLTQIAQATQVVNPTLENTPIPPTSTPPPISSTPTPVLSPTPIQLPCNAAEFVADVTYADGATIFPGTEFRKVWRIKNIGSCTWTSQYTLVWTDGFKMKGTNPQSIGMTVQPGQTADIGVDLTSPSENLGQYKSYYMLQDTNGRMFGVGAEGKTPLWIIANVGGELKLVYDMAPDAKKAAWKNSAAVIEYNKTGTPDNGYAADEAKPKMENGNVEDEAAILVRPDAKSDGRIQGTFAQVAIKTGDRFRAVIGCQYGYPKCNIKFILSYRVEGSDPIVIAEWNEISDNQYYKVDQDLSKLAGKTVQLILTVSANGDATDDYGIWLRPRVMGYR